MRTPAALAVVVAALGCGPPPPLVHPAMCFPGESIFLPGRLPLGAVAEAFTVPLDFDCDGGTPMSADVTISDPDNLPVALEPGSVAITSTDVNVTFTPTLAGPYHVLARLQPNLGVLQTDVTVATNHAAEAPAFQVDSNVLRSCTHVDITPAGHLLCLRPLNALFETDGGLIQELDAGTSAGYADGTLWLHGGQTLSRWVEGPFSDGGTGFVRSPDTLAVPYAQPLLFPTDGGVVAFDRAATFKRIAATDAGLVQTGGAVSMVGGAIAWANDTTAVVLGDNDTGLCVQAFDVPGVSCGGALGAPAGVDRNGIWILNDSFFSNHALDLENGQSVKMPIPNDVPIMGPPPPYLWETAPSIVSGTHRFIVGRKGGTFALDAFPSAASFVGATGSAVTFQDQATLLIYRR